MKPKPLPEGTLSLLHLGDSYTLGEGVEAGHSWPCQLHRMLEMKGWIIKDMRMLAQTGWTSGNLLDALASEKLKGEWDLVTLCIGVNNQYQDRDLKEFKKHLKKLLKRAMKHTSPDGQVILLSIPDWGVSPFAADRDVAAIRSGIDSFNGVCLQIADSMDIVFLEWTALSRLFKNEEMAFTDDGLHPSSSQYQEWSKYLLQQLVP